MAKQQKQSIAQGSEFVYQIIDITLVEATLSRVAEEIPDEMVYTCKLEINHEVNLGNGQVKILVSVRISRADTEDMLGKISVGHNYQIEDVEKHTLVEGKLPKEYMDSFNAESIATTRGIFYMLVKGTYLHKAIIPVVPLRGFHPKKP